MSDRMRKVVFEINGDFKGKMVRQRRQFMEYFLKAFSGNDESHKEAERHLSEFGVRILTERDAGDSMTVLVNGETAYRER